MVDLYFEGTILKNWALNCEKSIILIAVEAIKNAVPPQAIDNLVIQKGLIHKEIARNHSR